MLAVASRPGRADSAKTASARCLNDEDVVCVHLRDMRRAEMLDAAVDALDPVLPRCSGVPAGEAEGRDLAMIREQHRRHRLQEAKPALGTVAAAMPVSY